jgi:hypothetical protein
MNLQRRFSGCNPEMSWSAYPIYIWVKKGQKWHWEIVSLFYSEHSMRLNFRCMKSYSGKRSIQAVQQISLKSSVTEPDMEENSLKYRECLILWRNLKILVFNQLINGEFSLE